MRILRRNSQGASESGAPHREHIIEQRSWPQALVLLWAIAAAVAVALYLFVPPAVVPASAPATEFSAQRAMKDLRVIAREPNPMGSPEHEEVADYIVGRFRELGLSPQVQETTALRYDTEQIPQQVHAGRVKNILVRIPGTGNTGEAVLLASHYDSMPTTPAAADGAVSVATVLETVRAIQAGPPLKNDVIVYVGDADVNGVLGPIAFHEHPWSRDAGVGFAFEGTGPYGPSALVYDGQGVPITDILASAQNPEPGDYPSPRNGWWLDEALEVLPRPFVVLPFNSVAASPELGMLQLGTDAAGLGFAQFRGSYAYHTVLDNPQRLDPRSLQHQGQNAFSLTNHFGNLPLTEADQQGTPPLIAFNILPGGVVAYPSAWALPLAVGMAALLTVLLVAGILRGRLKVGGLPLGVVLLVLSVVGTAVVTTLAWKLITAINPAYRVWTGRGYYGSDWHLLFLAALSAAFITAVYLLAQRFMRAARDDEGVAAGALIVLALLAILTGTGMPSLSYLFAWPTLAGVLVLGFSVLTPARARGPWPRAVVLALTAFAPIILSVPPIYVFYTIQGAPQTVTSESVPQVVAAFVVLGLMLGTLLPHLWFLGGGRRWTVPAAFAALALVFLVGELVTTRFNASHPRPDYVQYRLDADTHQANWISDTIPPDAWTEQFFELGYEKGSAALAPIYDYGREFEVIRGAAPEVNLAAPRLKTLEDTTSEGVRTLRLRLVSARGAPYAHLQMDLPGEWVEARVNGEEIEASRVPVEQRRRFALMFYNLPEEGVDITLSVRSKDNIDATLTDYSNGLPDVPGMEVEPRPPEFMPAFLDFRDPTVVYRSFEL